MNRSLAAALGLLAAVCLPACDDDTADDGDRDAALAADADQDWDAATDAGGADEDAGGMEPDAALGPDMGDEPVEVDERWRLVITVAEAGGLRLPFQVEASYDDDHTAYTRFAIRSIDAADTPSPVLAVVEDAPIAADGTFVIDFGMVTLPAAYNPAGIDVMVTLRLDGQTGEGETWCGAVTGAVPLLGITLEESTFGAAVWPLPATGACDDEGDPRDVFIGGERPAEVLVPIDYDPQTSYPLVMVLHGYGAAGRLQAGFLRLIERVDADGIILVMPDGTVDDSGKRHWEARTCCGVGGDEVEDVAYLTGLVEEAKATWNVDAERVFAIGHSNGGFMAFDLACLAADTFRGVVSLAGSAGLAALPCPGAGQVAVLDVHGTADDTILYEGAAWHLGAEASVALWAERNHCGDAVDGAPLDLLPALPGAETTVRDHADCDAPVSLWTLVGEGHVPQFDDAFGIETLRWLNAAVAP